MTELRNFERLKRMETERWMPYVSHLGPERAKVVVQVMENSYKYFSLQLPHQKWIFGTIQSVSGIR